MIIKNGFIRKREGEWFNIDYIWFFEVHKQVNEKYCITAHYISFGHAACFHLENEYESQEEAQDDLDKAILFRTN